MYKWRKAIPLMTAAMLRIPSEKGFTELRKSCEMGEPGTNATTESARWYLKDMSMRKMILSSETKNEPSETGVTAKSRLEWLQASLFSGSVKVQVSPEMFCRETWRWQFADSSHPIWWTWEDLSGRRGTAQNQVCQACRDPRRLKTLTASKWATKYWTKDLSVLVKRKFRVLIFNKCAKNFNIILVLSEDWGKKTFKSTTQSVSVCMLHFYFDMFCFVK